MEIVILGNGITGVTAALRIRQRRPDWRIMMISGESDYHYSRPALMYIFMGHMRYADTKPFEDRFWDQQRIDRVRGWVTRIDPTGKQLHLDGDAAPIRYDRLLVATGSEPNRFGWPGQELRGVQGLYGLQDLERLYENVQDTRQAVIVGGGLIGIELAEMLHSRNIEVTFLIRETTFWNNVMPAEESAMLNRIIEEAGLGLVVESNLAAILDDGTGRAGAVRTDDGRELPCQLVGLTAGVRPNIGVVERSGIACRRGVLVDGALRTRAPDVFAAGDCAEIGGGGDGPGLVQQVWYTGRMQGEVVGDVISGEERTYDPGVWFNSAKFLDLEYQVYGRVNMGVDGEENLLWQHPDGRHALRLVHVGGTIIGFNLLGIRFRHEVCERWIREGRSIDHVLDHLEEAHFDPELYRRHEDAIRRHFRSLV